MMQRNNFEWKVRLTVLATLAGLSWPQSVRGESTSELAAAWPAVVARVNGHEVRKEELLTQVEVLRAQAAQAGQPDPATEAGFYREVLEGLIGEVLVYDDSLKRGKAATPSEVAQALAAMEKRYPDAAAFDQALAQQGTDREKVRRQLAVTLSVEKVMRTEIEPKIVLQEERVRAFYEANRTRFTRPEMRRARHLLRRIGPDASPAVKDGVRAKIEELLQQVQNGADMAALAREFSEDASSREQGGELPWIAMAGQDTAFFRALASLTVGQLSPVVESEAGLHFIQLLEVKPPATRPFAEVRDGIRSHLLNQEKFSVVQEQVERLRAQARIELLL